MTELEPTDWQGRLAEAVAKNQQTKALKRAERAAFAQRRNYGLAQRHGRKLARNREIKEKSMSAREQCRYVSRHGNRCTGEPVDTSEQAEVLLCQRHLGAAMQLLKARGFVITAPTKEKAA